MAAEEPVMVWRVASRASRPAGAAGRALEAVTCLRISYTASIPQRERCPRWPGYDNDTVVGEGHKQIAASKGGSNEVTATDRR